VLLTELWMLVTVNFNVHYHNTFSMALSNPTVTLSFKCIIDSYPSKPNLLFSSSSRQKLKTSHLVLQETDYGKWRNMISFFPGFRTKDRDVGSLKQELYETIAPLDRGAETTLEDQQRVDQVQVKTKNSHVTLF